VADRGQVAAAQVRGVTMQHPPSVPPYSLTVDRRGPSQSKGRIGVISTSNLLLGKYIGLP
jgi:hypothetical protein